MAVKRTPTINAKGQYKLIAPWTVSAELIYECTAIRSFPEMEERGVDVFSKIYEPAGLTRVVYDRDALLGANIITLMSGLEPVIHVPDTYIESFPNMDGMTYQHVVLSVSLGPVPDYLDLSYVKSQVKTVVASAVGVTADVKEHIAPHTGYINFDQHVILEANRTAAIANDKTDHGKVSELQLANDELTTRVKLLEKIIKDKGLLS